MSRRSSGFRTPPGPPGYLLAFFYEDRNGDHGLFCERASGKTRCAVRFGDDWGRALRAPHATNHIHHSLRHQHLTALPLSVSRWRTARSETPLAPVSIFAVSFMSIVILRLHYPTLKIATTPTIKTLQTTIKPMARSKRRCSAELLNCMQNSYAQSILTSSSIFSSATGQLYGCRPA